MGTDFTQKEPRSFLGAARQEESLFQGAADQGVVSLRRTFGARSFEFDVDMV